MIITSKTNLKIFSATLFIPLLIEFITVFRNGVNGFFTATIYISFLIISLALVFRKIQQKDIFILLSIYSLFIINMLIFPSTTEYYRNKTMIMNVMFYLPICSFVVTHIKDWNDLFTEMKPFAVASVPIAIYMVFFSDITKYEDLFTYMDFSYFLLPFVATLYIISRKSGYSFWYILFFLDAMCMIVYGARATFLMLLIFMVGYEYLKCKANYRIYLVITFLLIIGISTIFFDNIILFLSNVDGIKDSRLIAKAVAGQLSDGGERDMLISDSLQRIKTMDLDIAGIFGDRAYIRGIYPHNIALEILMQFGFILGGIILLSMVYIIYEDITRTKYSVVSIYLCCMLLGKFFFSGSYIQDGCFWIWLFSILNIFYNRKESNHKNKKIIKYSTNADEEYE